MHPKATLFLAFFCLIFQIISQSYYELSHLEGVDHSKVKSCVIDHPLIVIEPDQQNLRTLQTATPRGLIIDGVFPTSTSTAINISILQKIFSIASNYFKYAIKVTQMQASQTTYPSNGSTCGVTVPNSYKTSGFNSSLIDITIFIVIENKSSESYVAAAAPCILIRWPTYGYVIFNAAYVSTNLSETGTFHSNVYVTMHEMTHIFGVNGGLWTYFYQSYTSSVKTGQNNIITTVPGDTSKYMVITPSVKKFVQDFFSCTDTSMGALLQNNGGSGSAGSHWERTVYYDEMMTASVWPTGLKVTPLTLSLLKDTGFYYSVDLTMSQDSYYGKGKGCNFAKGVINPSPQFCNGSSSTCGFYADYGGPCSNTDQFANSYSYVRAYGNLKCTFPETGTDSLHFNFDAFSKCFMTNLGSGYQPHCYASQCTASGVKITANGETKLCGSGTSTVSIAGGTVQCPSDQSSFCGRKSCNDWCSTNGLCLRGDCMIPGQAYPTTNTTGTNSTSGSNTTETNSTSGSNTTGTNTTSGSNTTGTNSTSGSNTTGTNSTSGGTGSNNTSTNTTSGGTGSNTTGTNSTSGGTGSNNTSTNTTSGGNTTQTNSTSGSNSTNTNSTTNGNTTNTNSTSGTGNTTSGTNGTTAGGSNSTKTNSTVPGKTNSTNTNTTTNGTNGTNQSEGTSLIIGITVSVTVVVVFGIVFIVVVIKIKIMVVVNTAAAGAVSGLAGGGTAGAATCKAVEATVLGQSAMNTCGMQAGNFSLMSP